MLKTDIALRVLVVEWELGIAQRLRDIFSEETVYVLREADVARAAERLETEHFDLLLVTSLAIRAGEMDGAELLALFTARSPATEIVLLVHPRHMKIAMAALKSGNYQYAKFPISDEELRLLLQTALASRQASVTAAASPDAAAGEDQLRGRSAGMRAVQQQIEQAAATDIPVLILGETGTGKDITAQEIHRRSERRNGPYVPVHLGAVPQELVASELFGHEKGAFTSALDARPGQFELANGGVIFLDEISTVDARVQISLLRLIEQKTFHRLGGNKSLQTDARILAATNEDLTALVAQGAFREDLYYRLDVFRVTLPPLRERYGDIPILVNEFLARYNQSFGKNIRGIAPESMALLEAHDWPGNVRELKNVIQRAVLVCDDTVLLPQHLPGRFREEPRHTPEVAFPIGTPLREVEREMILRTLAAAKNRTEAAEMLGISRRALYNKIARYGIT